MSSERKGLRWMVFVVCVTLFLSALVWVTWRMLALEKASVATANEAAVQEKVRLALWRMDSLVSTLLVRENSRPPQHYTPFYTPTGLVSNASQALIPSGSALTPSPLLQGLPEFVLLHFELPDPMNMEQVLSPQVPVGADQTLAETWVAVSPDLLSARERLRKLSALLQKHPLPVVPQLPRDAPAVETEVTAAPPTEIGKLSKFQSAANRAELIQRQLFKTTNVSQSGSMSKTPPVKGEKQTTLPAPAQPTQTLTKPEAAPTDLVPHWLGAELILARQTASTASERTQGLWLDWPKLKTTLLQAIHDLLPTARLEAMSTPGLDASSLVTLPVRLIPNAVGQVQPGNTPIKAALITAWACFLLASFAVGLLLHHAMQLSERRGAFVSAVTHELRTPLTTFQLYSEMLAADMIPDAGRRAEYLQTLCNESARLTHLVENVLSYSRIERGRAMAKKERLRVDALLARLESRLRQRTAQAELELRMEVTSEAAQATLEVDSLGAEQVLFNLVDNACKYAAANSRERAVLLSAATDGATLQLRVRDYGSGLSKVQLKKLFRPFEKSATEAAHTAPGVGLGLALSKGLARDLGGDLTLESNHGGATFLLTLPVVGPVG
jgi:signal transduction histidine kinase